MSSSGGRSAGVEGRLDGDSESLLGELWATPVGRRWVLKAGLGSAVALGVGSRGVGVGEAAAKKRKARRVEVKDLQFAFGHLRGVSGLSVVANGKRLALVRHTRASRAELRRRGGLWGFADLSALTHYVSGVRLPADRGLLVWVYGRRGRREVLVGQAWHVPRAATHALAKLSHRATGSLRHVAGSRRRLAALGVRPEQIRSPRHVVQLETVLDQYLTAVGMVGLHPNIATVNPTDLAATTHLLQNTGAVTTLGENIARMQNAGKDIGKLVPATNPDGSLAKIDPCSPSSPLVCTPVTFSTLELNPQSDKGFAQALPSALTAGITGVRNDADLGVPIDQPLDQDAAASTQTWVQPEGVIPQPQPYTASRKAGAGIDIKVKNNPYPGSLFGTSVQVTGGYSNGQVPLKLYNSFVRWVWVYVQYLGKDSQPVPATSGGEYPNPNAKFPDTKYSKSLGLLPQVFTVLGVPLWDTNTLDVTLNFPEGAHTARLLFCGLGSNLLDGSWRQYFPADAYLDAHGNPKIAPTDEVLFPSLVTGILTIGLTVFALATDMDIASTWGIIRKEIGEDDERWEAVYTALSEAIVPGGLALTAAEATAMAIASGGATYEDIKANGGDVSNIWSILLALGSVIPKVIFNPRTQVFWVEVAAAIFTSEALEKFSIEVLPLIGQVIAIIEAVGDAVTLNEVCLESMLCPWVVENEVSLTYPATVTIEHDPADSSFPKTATSWRLEAKVDGALVLDPITGSINGGGKVQSDPVVVSVTAPFGGKTIQWSVVFLNSSGQQVGTGVSAQYTNDDPNNPPSQVPAAGQPPFTITEIPVPITGQTVFLRRDTTAYSAAAGGYTWSDRVSDRGTVLSHGIEQVDGATVSTLAGVAGVVWEQGNRFYVRGVPVAQNGSTIKLGPATGKGYARPPFLLFDAFVKSTDQGNHVLLEPDPTTPAYHVRKVSLDPVTGAPSWDPSVSYGRFHLPVSAAALHSSGRVVAIHTHNGRFAWLKPQQVPGPYPVSAAYSAGPGTQPGLLTSPIALAVTNPGVVLVLEAPGRLATFDLNGHPVRYFASSLTRRGLLGASGHGQYRLPLVSSGTYLDVAVDGAGQIYVLYYTGDGSAPGDYRVDVYTQAGAVLDTHSPGVNVPHLAVDYWRSIYAANYDPLADIATGQPHIDPALGAAEPSLSRFDPTHTLSRRPPKTHKPKHKHKHKTHKHK